MLLSPGPGPLLLERLQLGPARLDLLGRGPGECDGRPLGLYLLLQRLQAGLLALERRPRLIHLLGGDHLLLEQLLHPPVIQAGLLHVGLRLFRLRLGGGQGRLCLANLIPCLRLLVAQVRLALGHLGGRTLFGGGVVGLVGGEFLRLDDGQELACGDAVPFFDEQPRELALDL